MPINANEILKRLNKEDREEVDARAKELIEEEMTLRELRQARKITQVTLAKTLGTTQDSVSRLEKRSDLLLSTLRNTVEAMGGSLTLVASFPNHKPIILSGISNDEPQPKRGRKVHAHASR